MGKVLVTGGAGFIGSHVVDLHLEAGHQVVVVDDLSTGRRANLNPEATFIEMDIRDPDLAGVYKREKPDYVNHLAAQVDVRRSIAEPFYDGQVNILGSLNAIACACEAGVERFMYISTGGAVYGEPQYLPCDEEHPINPLSPYGVSKHTVEHYLALYQANCGLNYSVLRYPNVYGPRQDPFGEGGVVAIFTRQMLAGEPVTIFGDGEQMRDFTYVTDCVRAILLAEESGRDGVFNIGSSQGTTINQLFGMLKEITGYSGLPEYAPAKVGETYRIYLSAGKANRELGWRPEIDLRAGLDKTVGHFQERLNIRP